MKIVKITDSVEQTYSYGTDGKISVIKDAKGNQYKITYDGEKAEKLTKPNGEYQELGIWRWKYDSICS